MLQHRNPSGGKKPSRLARQASARFSRAVARQEIVLDDAQQAVTVRLAAAPARGFYLWGDVGRGKSMLADLFYASVPTTRKQRFHFHTFFRELQAEIFTTRQPIEQSIRELIGSAQVVYFDEFHVHDVADALYLTKTLEALIDLEVIVLATSNYAPHELMPDPLFHDRFLPAIALIESHFDVLELGRGTDYRRTAAGRNGTGFTAGEWQIGRRSTAGSSVHRRATIDVNGLHIAAIDTDANNATFTFTDLCEQPLGTNEYLGIAERFHAVRVIDVPDLAEASRDSLMRLSNLVDVLYHRDQQLDVHALAAPDRMHEAEEPPADVARTLSRLATLALVDNQ